ncbi:MAG: HD domain-containing protein [Hydrogenophilaceae bacterium]|nr:HD domain-containing protein [Hydrogenophilaceae bacterium]
MKRVKQSDIVIGKPLPFDCYDQANKLLLKKGQILVNENQLAVLIERGLYSDGLPNVSAKTALPTDKPSVFTQIALIEMRLDKLFQTVIENKPEPKFAEAIMQFARDIQTLCALDADAALGALHLNQKRHYTTAHPIDVAILAELIGLRKAMPEEQRRSMLAAALTANLSILELQETMQRQMSPLNEDQRNALRIHPVLSVERLLDLGVKDEAWFAAVLHHHEKQDGSGYPGAKRGDDIPLTARIIGLADTYSAMVTPRCYRPNQLAKDALREVFLKRGAEIDAELAGLFIKEMGIYPPGAFVKIANGDIAVVLKRGQNGTSPRVKAVIGPRGTPLPFMVERDTSQSGFEIREMVARNIELKLDLRQLWS